MRILVVGDLMLDHDRHCRTERDCPEAPAPVLLPVREEYRLGGAAAVAAMCRALGAEVSLAGVVGRDCDRLLPLLVLAGVRWIGCTSSRPTTVKERLWCGDRLIARVDHEQTHPLTSDETQALQEALTGDERPDLIIVSDYAKGACTEPLVRFLAAMAAPIIVDPPRGQSWEKYRGVACLTPNREEAGCRTPRDIREQYETAACIVKAGERGCFLSLAGEGASGVSVHLHARPSSPVDVTGAGDQFIATLAIELARGEGWKEAAKVANVAAGLPVVRRTREKSVGSLNARWGPLRFDPRARRRFGSSNRPRRRS